MIRFLKMFGATVWRRLNKYHLIYLSSLFLIYSLYLRLSLSQSLNGVKSYINLHYVAVHVDLKGSPPKISYLVPLLPILSMYGVNAIVMEYEDMFPYVGSIANISSVNAYKRAELLMFINAAKTHKIEIIPLIQTFGHMEFVLKLNQFAHLRERIHSRNICPSNPESLKLISTMLQQVMDLHAIIHPLQHIHIGCDEVFDLNLCPRCKERNLESIDLYVNHVKEVSSIVKGLNPLTKVLIWDDMLLQFPSPKNYFLSNVEVVSWNYADYPTFSHKHFYNLHKNFNKIWIASAFKGADGRNATIPNIKIRFQNHLSWMKFILNYKFGGEEKVHNFQGIILTGWSRYNHYYPQCEILPVAMPSLILNLLLIQTVKNGIDYGDLDLDYCEFYKKYLSKDFSDIFLNHGITDTKCAFENTLLYEEHEKLFENALILDCHHNLDEYRMRCDGERDTSYLELGSIFKQCKNALTKLSEVKNKMQKIMIRHYKDPIIKSYIDDIVNMPAAKIQQQMKYVKSCSKKTFWKTRK